MSNPHSVLLHIEIEMDFHPSELFPEGVPDPLTEKDVRDLIRDSGGMMKCLNDWWYGNLDYWVHIE